MTIDELVHRLATAGEREDEAALNRFLDAAQRCDTEPAERERVRRLADMIDADITAYDQGLSALDHGDTEVAETLLLRAAIAEFGDPDGVLSDLLECPADGAVSMDVRQHAAEARAHRAILKAAYARQRTTPPPKPVRRWKVSLLARRTNPQRHTLSASDLAAVLMEAMDVKDPYTRWHSERVSRLTALIARQVGLTPERVEAARLVGLFHDIGKLAVPTTVLHKRSLVSQEEYLAIKQHPARGAAIVQEMPEFFEQATAGPYADTLMSDTLAGIRHHHERFDGRGYPIRLAGGQIPELARMVAVADAFDAMTRTRHLQAGRTIEEALDEVRGGAGTNFDPSMVEAFLAVLDTTEARTILGPARHTPNVGAGNGSSDAATTLEPTDSTR